MDKCINKNCPIKDKCYRPFIPYSDLTNERNFEFKIIGKNKNHVECEYFWKDTHSPTKQIK